MIYCAILLFVAAAYGQQQKCIHSNIALQTADDVIGKLLMDMDKDGDRYVGDLELMIEFVGKFDTNADSEITRDEFVKKWHSEYKDVPEFADYMFCHFDQTGDGLLDLYDVPRLKALVDVDLDKRISDVEFTIFMAHLYNDCVPHTHMTTATGYC